LRRDTRTAKSPTSSVYNPMKLTEHFPTSALTSRWLTGSN
jgi:hypothetical protein